MTLPGSNLAPGSSSSSPDPSRALRARLFSGTGLTLTGLVVLLGGLAAILTFSSSTHAPILLEIAAAVTAGAALLGIGLVRMEGAFRAIAGAAAAHDPSILRRYAAVSWSLWVVGVLCLGGSDFIAVGSTVWPARFLQGVGSALILSGVVLYWFAHAAETERTRGGASSRSHAP